MLRSVYLFVFSFAALLSFGQNGTITGTVKDHKTQEPMIGVNVIIQGTTVGGATDINGTFTISNVKPGTYTLMATFISYKTQTIPDVLVEPGKKTTIEIPLVEDVAELEEVVVTARKEIATDFTLVNAIKESKLVVSGISSEQITKMPDRDAAQVAQRVPGVTIVDNRFILIRGLPERYNQVMINNAIAPSTEVDKRSFSFDLIPAGIIDQMLIYKSGTAELPGDFAGGVIQLVTKQPAYEEYTSFGLNFGFRANTTFKDYNSSEGSSTDIFGFDNGFRDLPESFPGSTSLKASARNSSVRERAGKSLTNNFDYTTRKAPLDMGFNFATSQNFKFGSITASNLTAVAYSNSYQTYTSNFFRYNTFSNGILDPRFEYNDHQTSNDVRVNLMHNWAVSLNDRNKVEFKNFFVQLGENETTLRTGYDKTQLSNADYANYAYHYLSRSIYSGQLQGEHKLGDGSSKFSWVAGLNYINRNEPDFRRFRTFRDKSFQGTEYPYTMQLPPSGNLFETGRFWSKLVDKGYSNGLNFEKRFGVQSDKRAAVFKAGTYAEYKTRSFDARYVNYLYPGFFDQTIGDEMRRLPLSTIFSPQNIKRQDGFVIEEGTTNTDSYSGKNLLAAGYASYSMPLGKFDLSAGFRTEYNRQELFAKGNDGLDIHVNNPVFAPLPSLNVAYNLTDRSLARIAYSRTINRPEFRELAPFLYYQFEYEAATYGNSDLKTAFINNVDLRYEFYPNPGEMISLGTFYKQFNDPIEMVVQVTNDNPQFVYRNAESANNYGVELEFRKSLASLGVSRLLRNTSFNVNAAWIKSEVNIGASGNVSNLQQFRPLQGQSPYIINIGAYYNDEEKGFSVNAAYNVFGPRIFSVGDKNYPSWYELPRNSVDFQIAQKWGTRKRLETKLNIQNALNAAYRIYQDSDANGEISKADDAVIQHYKVGTSFSAGISWKLVKE